jgi:outer membrane autotransporter protein
MKTRSYNKKLLSLIILPFVFNSLAAGGALAADITPGTGAIVTLDGTANADRIVATGDEVTAVLNAGAELNVTDQYPAVSLLGGSTVTLNSGSIINNQSTDYAGGIYIENINNTAATTNTVTLDNAEITVTSAGDYAESGGIFIDDQHNGGSATVSLDNGSSVAVTGTAGTANGVAVGYAYVGGIAIENMQDITITLDNNSSVNTTATSTSDIYSVAINYGIYAEGDDNVTVSLSNSSVTSTAAAVGGSNEIFTFVVAVTDGIDAETANEDSTISLDNSSITSSATATHTGSEGVAYAITNGIDVDAERNAIISLSNGSSVTAISSANGTATGPPSLARARGMELTANGQIRVTLDNSSVSATANATGGLDFAYSEGILAASSPSADIILINGSSISATSGTADFQAGSGIYISAVPQATVNIDATSSVFGTNYAVLSENGFEIASNTTVNNSGLISGRLQIDELNNSSTGTLKMNIWGDSAENPQLVGGVNEDGSSYFTIANTASLANGTTFAINPEDGHAGLEIGDTVEYRVLAADTGNWTQSALNITQSIGLSPMLGLSWSPLSDANNLVAQVTFLTPAQAGLSRNATAAFAAAYADGLFNFDNSPEDWTPDVSGANVSGATQFVGLSQFSISKRLQQQASGVNSGDGTVDNGLWADLRYTDADQDERDGIEGFDATTTSFTVGYDRQLNSAVTLGTAFSYGASDLETDASNEKFDMDDYLLTVYGGYDADFWFTEGQLSYGWGNIDDERNLFNTILHSSYDSNVYYARVAGGLKYAFSDWQVLPQTSLDYTHVEFDDYTEKGGAMALRVDQEDYDIANIGLGVQLLKSFMAPNNVLLTPEASAMVYYDLVGDEIETTSTFVHGTTPFVTKGADPDRTTYDLAFGLTIGDPDGPVSFKVGYEYIIREDYESHNVNGRLRFEF